MKDSLCKSSLRISMLISLLFTLLGSAAFPFSARATSTFITYKAIAAGDWHTCALTQDGGVQCWGRNKNGQLGDKTWKDHNMLVNVSGLTSGVTAIVAGAEHTCALINNGVKCWGWNYYGQLGNGTNTNSSIPVNVRGLTSGVEAIAAGGRHTCALTTGGSVKCWGQNDTGQLGDGTDISSNIPVDVQGLTSGVQAIAAGGDHTCALTTSGGVKCWGWNYYGQLGNRTNVDSKTPVDVSGLNKGIDAIASKKDHTCARTSSDGLKCWGWNYYGQLGNGTLTNSNVPVDVIGLSNVGEFVTGGGHTCARVSGSVKCWGANYEGQLGDGTWTDSNIPVNVGLPGEIKSIATGADHSCAVVGDNSVRCWGWNYYGQLGDGTNKSSNIPVDAVRLGTETTPSVANRDGWVLESTETSNQGGTYNTKATLIVGDDAVNKQYRSILYFDTKNLPDDAIIASATLKIKVAAATITNPFKTHGSLLADIKTGYFGTKPLAISDFQAPASLLKIGRFMEIRGQPGWYQLGLLATSYRFINLKSVTQFRLYFALDDNNDFDADFVRFYAGDASEASKPLLIIEYYAP